MATNTYKITRGKFYRRDEDNNLICSRQGDELELSDKAARRFGYNRLELVEGVSPGKKRKLVTQPKRGKGKEGEGNAPAPTPTGASPAAIEFAKENSVDITAITPARKDGKLTKTDVKNHLKAMTNGD